MMCFSSRLRAGVTLYSIAYFAVAFENTVNGDVTKECVGRRVADETAEEWVSEGEGKTTDEPNAKD